MSGYGFKRDEMPKSDYEALPEGWYECEIEGAEEKTTKDGSGTFISLRLKVNGPTHEARVLFDNLNIRNRSADAERIARQRIGEIMNACAVTEINSPEDFLGLEVMAKVTINQDSNNIKAYKAVNGSAAPSVKAKSEAPPAQQNGKRPWQR